MFDLEITSKALSDKIFVLLVDDEPDFLELSKIYLKKENPRLEIDSCLFVEEALKLLKNPKYWVVVSDYQMPSMDGLEFLEVLRTQGNNIPFIMFTGRGREEVAIKALNLGADRYIQKGGDPESQYRLLAQAIINEVARKQAEEKLYESEGKFRAIVTQSQDGIILANEEGDILEWNEAQALFTQIPTSKALGQKVWDIQFQFTPSNLRSRSYYDQIKSSTLKCLKTGDASWLNRLTDYLIERPDGTTRYMQQLPFGIKTQAGIMLCSIMRDVTDQKRTEQALQLSEEKLRNVIDSLPLGMHMYELKEDDKLVFAGANQAADEILGLDNNQFIGKTVEEAFPHSIETEIPEQYRRVARSGEPWRIDQIDWEENQMKGAFEVHAFQTSPGNMAALFRDVTEVKQAEQKLKESEKKYRELVENINEILYEIDANGIAKYVSSSINEILEYTPSEIIGRPFIQFVHPEDKQKTLEGYQNIASGRLEQNEYRILTKSGNIRWILTSSKPVFEGQKFVGLRGVLSDITNRKEQEEELRKSEARYKRIFEESPISLWEEDFAEVKQFVDDLKAAGISDFRDYFENHPEVVAECASLIEIIDVNQATLNLYKAKTKEELLGNLDKVFTEETYPAFKEELIAFAEDRNKITTEAMNKTLKGESIYVDLGLNISSDGSRDRALISIMDITDRKEAEKRESFLTTLLRHDLGNKIHVINGYLNLLNKAELSEENTRMVEKAMNSGIQCLQLIEKVRLLSDIDQKEELTAVSLGFHLKNAIKKNQGKVREQQIEIEYEEAQLDVMRGPLLEELFHNLLENAIRHSNCSTIRIASVKENERVVVSIEDDGKGINKEIRKKLFETTFIRRKRGMGTYIVKKIAENYGGDVSVTDSELGGARFDIQLKSP